MNPKRLFILLLLSASIIEPLIAQEGIELKVAQPKEIFLTGVYKGKPLFIQNPFHPGKDRFCINEIYVNKKLQNIDLNLSAIQLKFDGFDLYSPVNIKIIHKPVCKPIIINPDAILFHSSFKYVDIALNDTILVWHTKGDRYGAIFEVQKLYANGWEVMETIESEGVFEGAEYQYYPDFDEGPNKYRLKYIVNDDRYLYSKEVEIEYYPEPLQLVATTVNKSLVLTRKVDYEIMDGDGNLMLTGTGKSIDIRSLKEGEYFIYIGDISFKFRKVL